MDSELSDILNKRRNKESDSVSIESDPAIQLKSSSSSSLSDKEEHSGLSCEKVTDIIRSFEPQQLSEPTTRSGGTPKVVGAKRKTKQSDTECDATSCGSQDEKMSGSSEDGIQVNCTTPARGSASGPMAASSRNEVDRKVLSEPNMPQDDQQAQEGRGKCGGKKSKETVLSVQKEAGNNEEESTSRGQSPLSFSSKTSLHAPEDAGDCETDEARNLCRNNNVSEMVSLFTNLKAVANRASSSTILVTNTSQNVINDIEAQRIIQANSVSTKALLFEKLEVQDSPRTPSLRPSLTSIQEAKCVSTKASMFAKMQEDIKQEMEEKSRKICKRNSGICREPRKTTPTSPRVEAHPIMKGKGDEEFRQKLRKLSMETSKEVITEEDEGDGEPDPSNLSIADRVRFFSPKVSKAKSPKPLRRPKTSLTSSFTLQSSNASEEISSALNTIQSSDPESSETASASTDRDNIRERNVEAIEV